MYILDKYIGSRILKAYLLALSAFVVLYIIIDLFTNLGDFLKEKIPPYIVINYYLYMLPLTFLQVSPFSSLLGVTYAFAELNKNNEVMGMRTLGVSVFRLSLPAIILALLISSLAMVIQEKVLLSSQKKVEDIKLTYFKKVALTSQEQHNLAFRYQNMIFFISRFVPQDKSLEDVIIFKEDDKGNLSEKLVSRKITYLKGIWIAQDTIFYKLDSSGKFLEKPTYWEEKKIELDEKPENLIVKKSLFGEFTSLRNLKKEINRLKAIGAYNILSNLTVEFHRKISEPFTHFFLVIGVLPFVLEIKKRKVGLSTLGLVFTFGFLYYVIFSISLAFGKAQILLPSLSPWIAPSFFFATGISGLYLLR